MGSLIADLSIASKSDWSTVITKLLVPEGFNRHFSLPMFLSFVPVHTLTVVLPTKLLDFNAYADILYVDPGLRNWPFSIFSYLYVDSLVIL